MAIRRCVRGLPVGLPTSGRRLITVRKRGSRSQVERTTTTGRGVRIDTPLRTPYPAIAVYRPDLTHLRHSYPVARVGRVHHPAATRVDRHVVYVTEVEDQVTRAQVGGADPQRLLLLGDGEVGQGEPGGGPGGLGQAGAVERRRPLRRPQ